MITIIKDVGIYKPKNANWCYHIHIVIDETGAKEYRDTFGGIHRMKVKADKYLYTPHFSTYKWHEVKDMPDIEKYTGKNYQ